MCDRAVLVCLDHLPVSALDCANRRRHILRLRVSLESCENFEETDHARTAPFLSFQEFSHFWSKHILSMPQVRLLLILLLEVRSREPFLCLGFKVSLNLWQPR